MLLGFEKWKDVCNNGFTPGITKKMKVKVAQLCLTLCDHMNYTVHGILQARILEWVAFLFSRRCSQPRDRSQVSCIAGDFFTSCATREASITKKASIENVLFLLFFDTLNIK